jgi:hypothetical protein
MGKKKKYEIHLNLAIKAESYQDALELASDAIDSSKLLEQDGVVDVIVLEDHDIFELEKDNDDGQDYDDYGVFEEYSDLDEY